jgi:hypothetical protein
MFSDNIDGNGSYSPFHLTVENPSTGNKYRAYYLDMRNPNPIHVSIFPNVMSLNNLAHQISDSGYYIECGKTRSTDEPVSDSWYTMIMCIKAVNPRGRDQFIDFCQDFTESIKVFLFPRAPSPPHRISSSPRKFYELCEGDGRYSESDSSRKRFFDGAHWSYQIS